VGVHFQGRNKSLIAQPLYYTLAVSNRKRQVGYKRRGIARRFVHYRRRGTIRLAALLVVVGPGVLAGLSDDDPAGVTTYSILGTEFGYQLLWAIPISTALLVLFHLLAIRLAIRGGKGFVAVVRARYGHTTAKMAGAVFVLANFGTICAEFAGIGAVTQLAGLPTAPCVLGAAGLIVALVLAESFHRVEHVLLALSTVLASYLVAGVLAQPDLSKAARGLVVPSMPLTTGAFIAVTATIGTTLAPWGLAFIQSYAVDKGISRRDYGPERIEVVIGSLLTGIIGIFIAVACAATLATAGLHIEDARDAAQALRPLAGEYATLLFGIGLAGAGLLAAAIVPLATAYSLAEAFGKAGDLDDAARSDRFFYGSFVVLVGLAATIVSIPHLPLLALIYFSQLVNAILLAPHLVLLLLLNRDVQIVGNHDILSARWSAAAWLGIAIVVSSVLSLGVALLTT
jgi:Mn2+/Fe2+ NRAMP family transporter